MKIIRRTRPYSICAGEDDFEQWYSNCSVDEEYEQQLLRPDPAFQTLADQPLGEALGSQPTLSRWENAPSVRNLVCLKQALLDQFIRRCGQQVRQRGEILLNIDSTDDPPHGQQQISFF